MKKCPKWDFWIFLDPLWGFFLNSNTFYCLQLYSVKSFKPQGRKSYPNPKFLSTAEAYFVCHISPKYQISLIHALFNFWTIEEMLWYKLTFLSQNVRQLIYNNNQLRPRFIPIAENPPTKYVESTENRFLPTSYVVCTVMWYEYDYYYHYFPSSWAPSTLLELTPHPFFWFLFDFFPSCCRAQHQIYTSHVL